MSNSTIYFWQKEEDPYGFLCQWYPSPFTVDGQTYATTEMWMMIQKAKTFDDQESVVEMSKTTDPKKHKSLGRKVRNFDGRIWDEHKMKIVEEGNYHKFTQRYKGDGEGLLKKLLDTGDALLVEASRFDRVWGIGFSAKGAEANKDKWGENLLGKALMNVRDRLRREQGQNGDDDTTNEAISGREG